MKTLLVFFAFGILLGSFGLAHAETEVTLDSVSGLLGTDTLLAGTEHRFYITLANMNTGTGYNPSNGFRIFSPDGAQWSYPVRDSFFDTIMDFPVVVVDTIVDSVVTNEILRKYLFDNVFINYFSIDGQGADTVSWVGVSMGSKPGLYSGWNLPTYEIPILSSSDDHRKQICIDSSWFPPGGTWKWAPLGAGDQIFPDWSGQRCFTLIDTTQAMGELAINRDTLFFEAEEDAPNPPTDTFVVSEAGGGMIPYAAGETADWLDIVAGASGMTPGTVRAGVNIADLTPNTYIDSIKVESGDAINSPLYVIVSLKITGKAKFLAVDPTSLYFEAVEGGDNPDSQAVFVTETGDAEVPFNASVVPPFAWISLSNAVSTTADSIFVHIDLDNAGNPLDTGTYVTSILVHSDDAADTSLLVTLKVTPAPKYLAVTADTLRFEALEGGGDPPVDSFLVREVGDNTISFAVSTEATWFSLNPSGGTTPAWIGVAPSIAGLPVDSYFDSVEVTSLDAQNTVYKYVAMEIRAQPEFVLTPDTLEFSVVEGEGNPSPDSFTVSVSAGDPVSFTATKTADWITLDNASGATSANVVVNIDVTNLSVGDHLDSIKVEQAGGGAAAEGGVLLEPVWEIVKLTIEQRDLILVVSPDSLHFEANEGAIVLLSEQFAVFEQGDATIDYTATTAAPWIDLSNDTAFTPDSVRVTILKEGLTPGSYSDLVEVSSDTAVNSPVYVKVTLEITPCPYLLLEGAEYVNYIDTVYEDSTFTLTDTLEITSSGPSELDWSVGELGNFTVDPPGGGSTPDSAAITYERTFDLAGDFSDTLWFMHLPAPGNSCSSKVAAIVNVTVKSPPSADTLRVRTVSAVPGDRAVVPVMFSSSCDLHGLAAGVVWALPEEIEHILYLDSISYEETALEGFIFSDSFDNESGKALFWAEATAGNPLPQTSGNWLNLHFTVSCKAPLGFFNPVSIPLEDIPFFFKRDCGAGIEYETPVSIDGHVAIDTSSNTICGWVVDTSGTEIAGATVELWEAFPEDSAAMITTTSGHGSFAFDDISIHPFDLYAHKEGYYPNDTADITFSDKGVKIVLTPYEKLTVTPPREFVQYACSTNTYLGELLPLGSVVEARVTNEFVTDLLIGQDYTDIGPGVYSMPVYRANDITGDDGARTGNIIQFFVNGRQAITDPPVVIYPAEQGIDPEIVCLKAGAVKTKECPLSEGWNLVSWNVATSDYILDVLGEYMECIDIILGFEQGGLVYDPDYPIFSTLWQVDHLSGYWIRVKDDCPVTLRIEGFEVPVSMPIPLTTGWNLVSYLPEETLSPDTALAGILDHLLYAYGPGQSSLEVYVPGSPNSQLDSMRPCNGYWLKMDTTATLSYPGGEGAPGMPAWPTMPRAIAASGAVSDITPTPTWVNVFSSNLTLDGQTVNSGAVVTAHAASDGGKVGSFTISTNGQFGFMPVYAFESTPLKPGEAFYLAIDGVETDETFEWTGNGDRIEVLSLTTKGSSEVSSPSTYSLGQNYPNPFNPTTTLSFTLPKAGAAKIEIFNILGKLVAVPFDDQAVAGENTVVWDGRNSAGQAVASGIYLYRLSADDYSEARKMMLLK